MKMLVCTDGSIHSQQTVEEALKIAEVCSFDEVAIIHVYPQAQDLSYLGQEATREHITRFRELVREYKTQGEKILGDALQVFEKKNIKARTILKQGHPSDTIVKVAAEERVDMIVMGSRGLGGFKKTLLGSVSSAVVEEVNDCIVFMVKEVKVK